MIVNAYSILDTKAGIFSAPWFLPHDVYASRAVRETAQDRSTTIGKYPSDYVLYYIGQFDDAAGVLFSHTPRSLGVISAILAQNIEEPTL